MALDREMVDDLGGFRSRVYEWEQPCVTLGYSQDPESALLATCPIGYAMRPTGGLAVLHGHDITVSMAASLDLVLGADWKARRRSVKAVYRWMVRPLIATFKRLDNVVVLGEERHAGAGTAISSDCFAQVGNNDIVHADTGLKVCGCALRVYETSVLMQCSIPVREPQVDPRSVYRLPSSVHFLEIARTEFEQAWQAEICSAKLRE
ncbi:MAG: hypothetical protein JST40_04330 [Armatimonadetes bacterium]|nr:hypothetical protein [Armatimonadota bacterium]